MLRAQQIVDLVLARRVAAHQALQRRRLVGREVVDVQVGIGLQALRHEVDEALERRPLLLPIGGPIARVSRRRRQSSDVKIPEQKLQPAVADERITLEVEEDVACRGFGKAR